MKQVPYPRTSDARDDEHSPFRLLVSARKPGSKDYVWEIFRYDEAQTLVRRSSQTFKSMEAAYHDGSVALKGLHSSA